MPTPDKVVTPTAVQAVEATLGLQEMKGRATRSTGALLIRQLVLRALGLAGFLVLARLLTPEMFGIFVIAQFVVSAFDQVSGMGLPAALIRQKEAVTASQLRTVFTVQQLLVTAAVAGMWIAAPQLAAWYELGPDVAGVFQWMSVAILVGTFRTVPAILLQRELRHDRLAISQVAEYVAYLVTAITLAFAGHGVWALVIATIVRSLTGAVTLWRMAPWPLSWGVDSAVLGRLVRFAAWIQMSMLVTLANNSIVPVLVGGLSGAAAVGFVNLGRTLLSALAYEPLIAVGSVQLRIFGGLQDDGVRLKRAVEVGILFGALWMCPVAAMLWVLAPAIVEVLGPHKWAPAVPLLQWLSLAFLPQVVLHPCMQLLKATGDARAAFVVGAIKFLAEVAVFAAVAASLDFVGYALAHGVAVFLAAVYGYARVPAQVRPQLLKLAGPPAAAAGIAAAAGHAATSMEPGVAGVLLALVSGLLVYVGMVGLLFGWEIQRGVNLLLSGNPAGVAVELVRRMARMLGWLDYRRWAGVER